MTGSDNINDSFKKNMFQLFKTNAQDGRPTGIQRDFLSNDHCNKVCASLMRGKLENQASDSFDVTLGASHANNVRNHLPEVTSGIIHANDNTSSDFAGTPRPNLFSTDYQTFNSNVEIYNNLT